MNFYNHKTRLTASTIGVLLGLAGIINHGIFEILQGNIPTNSLYIEAIGEAHRFWIHGTEGAFTVIPNFLITGIIAVLVGLVIIFWSIRYMKTKYGANIFLLLMILLTLVGGGIGHIILFLPTWAFATRINKPLKWWEKVTSQQTRKFLANLWIYSLIAAAFSWLVVMELGIFGYFPGQTDPDLILNIVFGFLFATVILVSFSFICAFSSDINER